MNAFPSRFRFALLGGFAVAAITSGLGTTLAAQPNPGITIDNFAFAPSETTIPVGTTLTWTNAQGGVLHTTTSLDGVWDSSVLSTNRTFSFEFDQPGDFAYQCDVHPSMKGIIHVAAAPTDLNASDPVTTDPGVTNPGDQSALAATSTATPQATPVPPTSQRTAVTTTPAPYYGY